MNELTENELLWIEVRKLLVQFEIMKPNGEPFNEDMDEACRGFRNLILRKYDVTAK